MTSTAASANPHKISILLADDHSLVRDGIRSLLEDETDLEVIAEATNGEEALEKVAATNPDILIVDIRMPKLNGIQTVARLTNLSVKTKALVLSMHDSEEYVLQSIEAGAYGYLLKDTSKKEFIKAIHTVYEGEKYFSGDISPILVKKYLEDLSGNKHKSKAAPVIAPHESSDIKLTKRQKQILELAVTGMSNKEIADHLGKSVRTVEAHRFSMMKKLDVNNLLELINKAKELGLVD